ncbi:MAG: VWA domain-containing protein, partial [Acidobacteriia bacterium]|nr:VWA domain-containing protein [Terriglobia bacterium]
MHSWKIFAAYATVGAALAGILIGQEQGPNHDPGATVARPRKPASDAGAQPDDADLPKIPSKLSKKGQPDTTGLATFKSDVDVVTADVAVLDNKGHFIPG